MVLFAWLLLLVPSLAQAQSVSERPDAVAVTIYRDGPTAEFGAKGKDMVVDTRAVKRGETLTVHMAPGGGFAIRIAAR